MPELDLADAPREHTLVGVVHQLDGVHPSHRSSRWDLKCIWAPQPPASLRVMNVLDGRLLYTKCCLSRTTAQFCNKLSVGVTLAEYD